jgi:hypothetical protein
VRSRSGAAHQSRCGHPFENAEVIILWAQDKFNLLDAFGEDGLETEAFGSQQNALFGAAGFSLRLGPGSRTPFGHACFEAAASVAAHITGDLLKPGSGKLLALAKLLGCPSCGSKETVIVRLLAQRELRLKLSHFTDNPEELLNSY